MPTLQQILVGVEGRLQTIPGLRLPGTGLVVDQVNPPAAVVGIPPIDSYRETMRRGKWLIQPTITVLVSASLDRTGQLALAEYADHTGPRSIITAVEGDRTLGGTVDDCIVQSFRPLGLEEVGLIGYYGGEFTLLVAASGA